MELRQLHYLLVLAAEGNYLNAAEELFISQSQLSKKIMALEQELGVTLFDRSKRKIAITPEGRLVLKYAKKILATSEAMKRAIADFKGQAPTEVIIFSVPVLAPYKIPGMLARFRKAEPQVTIRLKEVEANVILPALTRGQAELGLVREPFVDPSEFRFTPICQDEVLVIVPPGHRLIGRQSIDLTELREERFILPDKQTLLYDFYLNLCERKGVEPGIVHTSTRTENIVEMVASGMGISLMMRQVVEYLKNDVIHQIELAEPVKSRLGLAWLREARLSEGARRFVSFVNGMRNQSTRTLPGKNR